MPGSAYRLAAGHAPIVIRMMLSSAPLPMLERARGKIRTTLKGTMKKFIVMLSVIIVVPGLALAAK